MRGKNTHLSHHVDLMGSACVHAKTAASWTLRLCYNEASLDYLSFKVVHKSASCEPSRKTTS